MKGGDIAKTLDMKGREKAVELVEVSSLNSSKIAPLEGAVSA